MRVYVRLFLSIGLVLGSALPSAAQPLTPEACAEAALVHNRALGAARAAVAEAEAVHREAQVARLPVLRATGSYQRLSANIPDFETTLPVVSDDVTFAVPAIQNRYDLALRLQQPLFTGFRLRSSARAARHAAEATRQDAAAAEADLVFEVHAAYWSLYEARAARAVARDAQREVAALLRDARNRAAAGMALRGDVLALQARRAEVRLEEVEAEDAVRLARLRLGYLTGQPIEEAVPLAAGLPVRPTTQAREALVAQALRQRPAVAALEQSLQAHAARVRTAQAAWYPSVELVGSYLYARPNTYFFPVEDRFQGTWEVGLTATVDLWTWGRPRTQARQAEARRRAAEEALADLQARVRLEVMEQALAVDRAVAAWGVVREEVAAAREAYRAARTRFRQGAALTTEVLEAEAAVRRAEGRRAAVRAAYATARAGLQRAVGGRE